eukprot:7394242-Lingulodinium_polyedra.AAC.1
MSWATTSGPHSRGSPCAPKRLERSAAHSSSTTSCSASSLATSWKAKDLAFSASSMAASATVSFLRARFKT